MCNLVRTGNLSRSQKAWAINATAYLQGQLQLLPLHLPNAGVPGGVDVQTPPAGGNLSCQVHIPGLIQVVLTLLQVQAGRALASAQVLAYSLKISLVTG